MAPQATPPPNERHPYRPGTGIGRARVARRRSNGRLSRGRCAGGVRRTRAGHHEVAGTALDGSGVTYRRRDEHPDQRPQRTYRDRPTSARGPSRRPDRACHGCAGRDRGVHRRLRQRRGARGAIMVGSYYGARLTGRVNLDTLLGAMGWVLLVVGALLVWRGVGS